MDFDFLYQAAHHAAKPRDLSAFASAGGVGAALLIAGGKVYTGVCIDTACSMGFCAEHAAAAAMVTAGENEIVKMVAVSSDGKIAPPCGRCREFLSQLAEKNGMAQVMVGEGQVVLLKDLLPWDWKK